MNRLATIERIDAVDVHPNADLLEIAVISNYKSIVKKGQYKVGDLAVFVRPDSRLPENKWAEIYRAKSSRVKAIKLRNVWSQGIVETFDNVGYNGPIELGLDVTSVIGVTKWEAPQPQDLNAIGGYPFGIPKTDEERYQSVDVLPYGEPVDVTLKIDGQSISFVCKLPEKEGDTVFTAVGGRSFLYKPDSRNNYTQNQANYDVLNRLEYFCRKNNVSLCLRGESFGAGIQKMKNNPHSKLNLGLALFSVWLIDEHRYATKEHPFYIYNIASLMGGVTGLPTVPILETNVILTPELVKKYEEDLETINGQPFEGVVVNHRSGSFKIINVHYDAKK